MRFPDELKFDADMAQAVNLSPQNIRDSSEPFQDPIVRQEPIPVTERTQTIREMYVRNRDLDQFGFTPGCPRCEHTLQYGPNKASVTHNQTCRERIRECLRASPEGRARLAKWEQHADRQMAEEVHRGDDRLVESHAPQGEIDENGQARPPTISEPVPPPPVFLDLSLIHI